MKTYRAELVTVVVHLVRIYPDRQGCLFAGARTPRDPHEVECSVLSIHGGLPAEGPNRCSDAEWAHMHFQESSNPLCALFGNDRDDYTLPAELAGASKFLVKGRMVGTESGWETVEYDEEFEVESLRILEREDGT